MIKVAIDSSTLFSAIVYRGIPRQILKMAEDNKIRLGIPEYCLLELKSAFYDKFGEDKGGEYYRELAEWANDYAILIIKPRNDIINEYKGYLDDIWDVPVIASVHAWTPDYLVVSDKKFFNERLGQILNIVRVTDFLNLFNDATGQAR